MPKSINRRVFINTIFLTTISPSGLSTKPTPNTTSRTSMRYGLEKLAAIDNQFISVDGWILPTKALTEGVL